MCSPNLSQWLTASVHPNTGDKVGHNSTNPELFKKNLGCSRNSVIIIHLVIIHLYWKTCFCDSLILQPVKHFLSTDLFCVISHIHVWIMSNQQRPHIFLSVTCRCQNRPSDGRISINLRREMWWWCWGREFRRCLFCSKGSAGRFEFGSTDRGSMTDW